MATFNEIKQRYVNLSYSQLLGIARENLSKLMPMFNTVADDGKGIKFLLVFFGACFSADGKFTELEYRFMSDLTSVGDYDTLKGIVQASYNNNSAELADKIYDVCPASLKPELLSLCLCLVSIDETITKEENAFLQRLVD